jgi:tetratricopeptide (TPR) repeat protein
MLYLQEGDKEAALRHLLKAESIDDSDAELAQILGELLIDQGRDEEAAERLKKADPESAANLANLGIIAVKQERFAEAETLLRRSLAKEPTQALLWGYLADALVGQGKAVEALAAYDQALRYDPEDIKSLITAGTLAADHDRPQQALGYLNEALKRAPQDGYVHYGLALVMERLGDPEGKAQQHYLRALELGEDRPNAHFRLMYLFARQSEKEKALEHMEAALEKDSKRFYPHLMDELRQIRSDLDSIRYTPKFAELLAKYKPQE